MATSSRLIDTAMTRRQSPLVGTRPRALARGEMAASAPVREAFDALAGAVLVRALSTGGPPDDQLDDVLMALVLEGVERS